MDGNQVAQEIIYNKYKKVVNDYIQYKYSASTYIDDDVSEVMIKIFLNLKTFDANKSKFKSWVISIVKNHMIDKWRCSANILTSLNNVNITTLSDGYGTPTITGNCYSTYTSNSISEMTNTNFEHFDSVNFISSQLSPEDYTMLNMKYMQGYNYCEIGKEFNMTSETISNKVNYIKSKLKKNMPELDYR